MKTLNRDAKGRFVRITDSKVYMSGFKGFEKGMVCRSKHYKEYTVFEEPYAFVCRTGMHFCSDPLSVFEYYPPVKGIEYARVDALAPCDGDGSAKFATTKLRVNDKIDLDKLYKIAVQCIQKKVIKSRIHHLVGGDDINSNKVRVGIDDNVAVISKNSTPTERISVCVGNESVIQVPSRGSIAAAAGRCSFVSSIGAYSVAASTNVGSVAASQCERSAAISTTTNSIAKTCGYKSVACNTGGHGLASSSDTLSVAVGTHNFTLAECSGAGSVAITTGDICTSKVSGNFSAAIAVGTNSQAKCSGRKSLALAFWDALSAEATGSDSAAFAFEEGAKVRGALGCVLAAGNWRHLIACSQPKLVGIVSARVDGKKIKANTWYTVVKGKFKEVKE